MIKIYERITKFRHLYKYICHYTKAPQPTNKWMDDTIVPVHASTRIDLIYAIHAHAISFISWSKLQMLNESFAYDQQVNIFLKYCKIGFKK